MKLYETEENNVVLQRLDQMKKGYVSYFTF